MFLWARIISNEIIPSWALKCVENKSFIVKDWVFFMLLLTRQKNINCLESAEKTHCNCNCNIANNCNLWQLAYCVHQKTIPFEKGKQWNGFEYQLTWNTRRMLCCMDSNQWNPHVVHNNTQAYIHLKSEWVEVTCRHAINGSSASTQFHFRWTNLWFVK